MDEKIFSRSTGVMCFSRPLLLLLEESCLRSSGRALETGGTGTDVSSCSSSSSWSSSSSSVAAESRLEESSGTGMSVVAACGLTQEHGGESAARGCWSGVQQKVSRFHSLQLRFSSLLPSSIAWDVLENRDHCSGEISERPFLPTDRAPGLSVSRSEWNEWTNHAKEILD